MDSRFTMTQRKTFFGKWIVHLYFMQSCLIQYIDFMPISLLRHDSLVVREHIADLCG